VQEYLANLLIPTTPLFCVILNTEQQLDINISSAGNIGPNRSEILSVLQVFPCTTQIALFWPELLPALFLKKP
jgi:hypothetical protein